ncbi:MAG TPA: TatD family hydrolase [Actinomycetota bacterium]|nr:TatD family hydrolase [Actinomycetota bacterium]
MNPPTIADSHCHIAHIDDDPERIVADALDAGVGVVIDIGMGPSESSAAADRAVALAPHVYATVGVHPNELAEFEADPEATTRALRALAGRPRVVGIGETGLDYYRERSPAELQETAFRAQISLARETGKALVVHCRDAHEPMLRVLEDAGPPDRVVMHCFSGDVDFAAECAERGYYCSFAGNLTYPKSEALRAAARRVPAELLLVETDAPFLAPQSHRGKPNHPALLPNTVEALAAARAMPVQALIELLARNTRAAFRIDW